MSTTLDRNVPRILQGTVVRQNGRNLQVRLNGKGSPIIDVPINLEQREIPKTLELVVLGAANAPHMIGAKLQDGTVYADRSQSLPPLVQDLFAEGPVEEARRILYEG